MRTLTLVKLAGGTVALLLALFAGALLLFRNPEPDIWRFGEAKSSDGVYSLTIDVQDPSLPYGPHSVILTIRSLPGEEILEKSYRLANDGARIDDDNIRLDWDEPGELLVCLKGAEQSDMEISIHLPSGKTNEETKEC